MNERRTKTILIVEDDKLTSHVYSSLFQRAGFHVETVADGLSALSFLERTPPDAVLLDLMLPGKSGLEVLKEFRSKPMGQTIPVTVVTNAFIPHFVDAAKAEGVTSIFSKADVTPLELTDSFRCLSN